MPSFLSLLAAALLGAGSTHSAVPAHFQIEIIPAKAGFTAHCATGCRWTSLSFDCASDCNTVIDQMGVYTSATTKQSDASFAFHFHLTAKGWALESLGGTAWKSLSWDGGRRYGAQVDEFGVGGIPASGAGH